MHSACKAFILTHLIYIVIAHILTFYINGKLVPKMLVKDATLSVFFVFILNNISLYST